MKGATGGLWPKWSGGYPLQRKGPEELASGSVELETPRPAGSEGVSGVFESGAAGTCRCVDGHGDGRGVG